MYKTLSQKRNSMIYDHWYFCEWHRINIKSERRKSTGCSLGLMRCMVSCQFSNKIENNDAEKEERTQFIRYDKGADWGNGKKIQRAFLIIWIELMNVSKFVSFSFVFIFFYKKNYQIDIESAFSLVASFFLLSFVYRHSLASMKRYKCEAYWHFSILLFTISSLVFVLRLDIIQHSQHKNETISFERVFFK